MKVNMDLNEMDMDDCLNPYRTGSLFGDTKCPHDFKNDLEFVRVDSRSLFFVRFDTIHTGDYQLSVSHPDRP